MCVLLQIQALSERMHNQVLTGVTMVTMKDKEEWKIFTFSFMLFSTVWTPKNKYVLVSSFYKRVSPLMNNG